MQWQRGTFLANRDPGADGESARDSVAGLVARAKEGDGEAFALLYRRYLDEVYGFVAAHLSDRQAVEDATQTIFFRAMQSLHTCRDNAAFPGWLFAIARNVVTDTYRSHKFRPGVWDESLDPEDPTSSPEEIAVQRDSARDATWLIALFRQVLDVELIITEISEEEYDALYVSDEPEMWPQLDSGVWWGDPDPRDWFVVWRCGSEFYSGYCNPALDALLDRADAELNPETRIALYEEAGHMLVADAPAIFLNTSFSQVPVKPYVVGYSRTAPNGNYPGWTNLLTVDVVR